MAAPELERLRVFESVLRLVEWSCADRPVMIALDDALNALARLDPRKVQVVEMRFFGGLSVEETAEVLKVSAITVMRDWSTAKAWLYRELKCDTSSGASSGASDGL